MEQYFLLEGILKRFDPATLMGLVERHRVTRLLVVPTIATAMLHHRERSKFDLSSLQQIIIGGSPASPDLVRALEAELGTQAICGYGLTETSPIVTLATQRRVVSDAEPPERRAERQAMTGWAIPGVQVRVLDAEGRDVRPDGQQIGEISRRHSHFDEGDLVVQENVGLGIIVARVTGRTGRYGQGVGPGENQ